MTNRLRAALAASVLALAACQDAAHTPLAAAPVPAAPTAEHAVEPSDVAHLVADLVSDDFPKVLAAKEALESRQADAMPPLLALLDDRRVVKLTNTMDLIYPGAESFYGHGFIVDYDLDWIPVRAGWVIEELAFVDFGFREGAIREEDLLADVKRRGMQTRPLGEAVDLAKDRNAQRLARERSAEKAMAWWKTEGAKWTRLAGLVAALKSDGAERHMTALEWLRFGKTCCDGLDAATYDRDVRSEIERLAAEGRRDVREQAKLLLEDRERYWLKAKGQ